MTVTALRVRLLPALACLRLLPLGARAQCRLVFARLIFPQLIAVFDAPQPRLHGIEFRSGHDVLLSGRQDVADLLLNSYDALWRRRVGGEELWHGSRLPFLLRFHLLEESHERVRVVPCR